MTTTPHTSPATVGGRAPAVSPPCNRCGARPARLYAGGRRCATCTPAALAGLPEPTGGYCAPLRHYCPPDQRCPTWTPDPRTEETA